MQNDPYTTPATNAYPTSQTANGGISQGVIQQLAGTKPWVRFISVMIFIGAGLMLLVALAMLLAGSAIASASKNPMFAGGMGFGIASGYAVFSLLYIYPGLKLWKYASYIGSLMNSRSEFDLEMALNQQRSFWKFLGVIMLVILSLYVLIIVGGIVLAIFGAMSVRH